MSDAVERAQRAIAEALAELEAETEGYVRGVNIVDVEITTMNSTRRQMNRRVEIKLDPKPGTKWSG